MLSLISADLISLVNNAGVLVTGTIDAPARDQAAFDTQYAINVKGVVAAVAAASRVIADDGRIVSISTSDASRTQVPFPGAADYIATKAALAAYTSGWARDLGARGITVNLVQPGPTSTDMAPTPDSPLAVAMLERTALGRFSDPEEIAAAVSFLVGPAARNVTGATLRADAGMFA
jgi:3-oxoacyl-[acyl-carrier protein] reductase